MTDREVLLELYRAALHAVHAGRAVERVLAEVLGPAGRVSLLAVGKAAGAMALGARRVLGPRLQRGFVHTRADCASSLPGLGVREAGHPLPDARSIEAADEALRVARTLAPHEALLVLLSGGASALWCAPAEGLDLAHKREVTDALLKSGAAIGEINAVRKHLSRIKGGQLARAAGPARMVTLAVSDVRGDRPDVIGSGPTVPDATTFADALAILDRHALLGRVPVQVREHLERGAGGLLAENPGPDELGGSRFRVVARLGDALAAAAEAARRSGTRVIQLGECLYGDVEALARDLAARVRAADDALLVAGGEPDVRVRGPGRGGRCQELALRLALELEGDSGWLALCAGSDGSDGPTDAAGAVVDPGTLQRARAHGLDALDRLAHSDSFQLLSASGDLLHTGPTDTNVADLVLIRVRR